MSRSLRKGPYVQSSLRKKIDRTLANGGNEVIKTWSRRSTILPEYVGLTFAVHNGRKFISVYITENMVGHRLGEFAATRTFKMHSGDRKAGGR